MTHRKIALAVTIYDAEGSEARDVAKALFEAFWKLRQAVTLDELTIDGEAAYGQVKAAYLQNRDTSSAPTGEATAAGGKDG